MRGVRMNLLCRSSVGDCGVLDGAMLMIPLFETAVKHNDNSHKIVSLRYDSTPRKKIPSNILPSLRVCTDQIRQGTTCVTQGCAHLPLTFHYHYITLLFPRIAHFFSSIGP
jgi:hypothetical protein